MKLELGQLNGVVSNKVAHCLASIVETKEQNLGILVKQAYVVLGQSTACLSRRQSRTHRAARGHPRTS